MKKIASLLFLGAALGLVAAGCSGEPEPQKGDNPAASSAVSSDSPEMKAKTDARNAARTGAPSAVGGSGNLRNR